METYLVRERRLPANRFTDCWPLMSENNLLALVADIKERGQLEDVVISADGERLVDGRDRCRACERLGFRVNVRRLTPEEDENLYARGHNGKRKHLDSDDLAFVAEAMCTLEQGQKKANTPSGVTQEEAAAETGASVRSVQRVKKISVDPNLVAAVKDKVLPLTAAEQIVEEPDDVKQEVLGHARNGMSGDRAVKMVLTKRRSLEAEKNRARREGRPKDESPVEWYTCAVADLPIPDESVDHIITDPPYVEECVRDGVWADLVRTAARVLRPGGQCVMLCGHYFLDRVIVQIHEANALRYRWIGSYYLPGRKPRHHLQEIMTGWKPYLIYEKPDPNSPGRNRATDKDLRRSGYDVTGTCPVSDVMTAPPIPHGETEKIGHKWQQNLDGMMELVKRFAVKGQTILDPFCGGGTIPLAAKQFGCKVIASDIDPESISTSKDRINLWYNKQTGT